MFGSLSVNKLLSNKLSRKAALAFSDRPIKAGRRRVGACAARGRNAEPPLRFAPQVSAGPGPMTTNRSIHPRQCRAAREVQRITQAEAASAIGVSASALSLFERGRRQLAPDAMARLIAFYAKHRVTFWHGEDQGIYFVQSDGSYTGVTIGEGVLRN